MVASQKAQFEGTLVEGHKGAAIEVPFDPAIRWEIGPISLRPGRRGFPVDVVLNGTRFRSAIVPRMRRFFVLVDDSVLHETGAAIGGLVRITIRPSRP